MTTTLVRWHAIKGYSLNLEDKIVPDPDKSVLIDNLIDNTWQINDESQIVVQGTKHLNLSLISPTVVGDSSDQTDENSPIDNRFNDSRDQSIFMNTSLYFNRQNSQYINTSIKCNGTYTNSWFISFWVKINSYSKSQYDYGDSLFDAFDSQLHINSVSPEDGSGIRNLSILVNRKGYLEIYHMTRQSANNSFEKRFSINRYIIFFINVIFEIYNL